MIIIFENTNYSAALRQPFFKQLAARSASFSNFYALTHLSQGNYIALTSGDLNGIRNDDSKTIDVANVADLLEAQHLSWKVYAEDYPGNCFKGSFDRNYARKHNPFISYTSIQNKPARCANIVDASHFDQDTAKGTLPDYMFYVPDQKHNGHDTGVEYADQWYRQKFSSLFVDPNFMRDTVVITTFDESGLSLKNQIYTTIYGPAVRPGTYSQTLTTPSLLKLVEDNWGLGNLGKQDVSANPIPNVWQ